MVDASFKYYHLNLVNQTSNWVKDHEGCKST
jgi:hypothetical protein